LAENTAVESWGGLHVFLCAKGAEQNRLLFHCGDDAPAFTTCLQVRLNFFKPIGSGPSKIFFETILHRSMHFYSSLIQFTSLGQPASRLCGRFRAKSF
jgi:hypothetical protein